MLAFAEYGDPAGHPVPYSHGWPSSRLEAAVLATAARRHGVRVVAPDRPGIGRSDHARDRTLMDWPADVIGLADALGLGSFGVLGASGGGPYAAVCAARIPERVHAVGIVSGVGPPGVSGADDDTRATNRFVRNASRCAPWLIGVPLWVAVRMMNRDPTAFFGRLARRLPEPDRTVLAQPRYQEWLNNLDPIFATLLGAGPSAG